jgi:glycosyltransferase involved in cell wall biosynthesis
VLAPRGMLVPELLRRRGGLRKRLWIALFERRNLAAAAAIQVTSRIEAVGIAALGLARAPLALLPNGVERGAAASSVGAPESASANASASEHRDAVAALLAGEAPFVLFLGRLSWKKGLDVLLGALARLPGVPLVVAGPDDEDYRPVLERQARSLGLGGRVWFTGHVEGAWKERLLRGAALLVLPSINENFGNVALEAMAVETAVVVTPGVGFADTLAAAGAGVVAPPTVEGLAQAIAELLADRERRTRLAKRGRELVETRFSWPAIAADAERLYAAILAGRGVPSDLEPR